MVWQCTPFPSCLAQLPFVVLTIFAIGFAVLAGIISVVIRNDPDPSWKHTAREFLEGATLMAVIEVMVAGLLFYALSVLHPTRRGR